MNVATKRALVFRQWLRSWDDLSFPKEEQRRKPNPNLLMFSMSAAKLRALSGVFRRERSVHGAEGIQRYHEDNRSVKIRDFVENGYPYCEMSQRRRAQSDISDLKKPGWLPTSIVVNILLPGDRRPAGTLEDDQAVRVHIDSAEPGLAELTMPTGFSRDGWRPSSLPPFEVIDGQHRLFAFDDDMDADFELPVVAFVGLDLGWQAYLFWSINVSPKKINPSHAFDLYPLLRTQQWLEKFSESYVYREARAQELTEILYRHSDSPWRERINMLGDRRSSGISQAAWIRSLYSTFLSSRRGLYGAVIDGLGEPLGWTRAQQAALLIYLWQEVHTAATESGADWLSVFDDRRELAVSGPDSLLNQEQGVRGMLAVANEMLVSLADTLDPETWKVGSSYAGETTDEDISEALGSLRDTGLAEFISSFAAVAIQFDWRSVTAPGLSPDEQLKKRALRGSGGYALIKRLLLEHLADADWQESLVAKDIIS